MIKAHKKLVLVLLIATIAVVSFFIFETYKAHTVAVDVPPIRDAFIGIGASTVIKDITLSFLDVTEDSRCPVDVRCVWAGRVVAKVLVSTLGQNTEALLELGKPMIIGDYSVLMTALKPNTHSEGKISKDSYRALFTISKVIHASFSCSNNALIDAQFISNIVELKISDRGEIIQLPIALSASGARYANGDESIVFWNKGNTAFITENGTTTYSDCVTR